MLPPWDSVEANREKAPNAQGFGGLGAKGFSKRIGAIAWPPTAQLVQTPAVFMGWGIGTATLNSDTISIQDAITGEHQKSH